MRYIDGLSLDKLDSLTKYPSILDLHAMGERGRLKDEVQVHFPSDTPLEITEKIDGVNARVVVLPDGEWVIGSRNELLGAQRDRIRNPAHGIVAALLPQLHTLGWRPNWDAGFLPGGLLTIWCEVYGGSGSNAVKRAGCYTASGHVGVRVFDTALWSESDANLLMGRSHEHIAGYRDRGEQPFNTLERRENYAALLGAGLVPVLSRSGDPPPASLAEAEAFVKQYLPATLARIDDEPATSGPGPEGIVLRTPDRKVIAKMRLDDYRRTLQGHHG